MKKINAYLLFTGWRYRLGIFLGIPAAVLAGGFFWRCLEVETGFGYLVVMGIIFAETVADRGIFSGIQSHRGYRLDFFKTSPVGQEILFQGLCGDLARRLVTAAVCVGGGRAAQILDTGEGWAGCLGTVLTVYFAEALGLFISRFTRSAILCLYTAYGCVAVGMILYTLIRNIAPPWLWAADGALGLAAAAVSALVVRTGMKRWRGTYSDTDCL